jgi:hypothetical protein|uniref:Uncharacterized protein n=1 Tax=Picea glauca TaxID=3330 RepID=A0A101LXF8_PICGL|nr:hypothetical protein ABT39_MTgene6155 [Picea glauca]QHR88788.1 hypothetical protein Q903MT_gene2803 [Picea sitchensis]
MLTHPYAASSLEGWILLQLYPVLGANKKLNLLNQQNQVSKQAFSLLQIFRKQLLRMDLALLSEEDL